MELVSGPFRKLEGEWRLTPIEPEGCRVELNMRFAFSHRLTAMLFEPKFAATIGSLVDAFVARARERQYLWSVELPVSARIADALAAARAQAPADLAAEIPWERAPVGIFGEPRSRNDSCEDGDRIELYRPLQRDPRARRRERVERERRSAKRRG